MSVGGVTPVVLTLDEEANIGRTLESLRGFRRVVVVDSGSGDGTEAVTRSFENVAWFVNAWKGFEDQWSFAFRETAIDTPFVLALDADMAVPDGLAREVCEVAGRSDVDGGMIKFDYRIRGVSLAGSLYPAQLRLLRVRKTRIGQAGHAHLFEVDGTVVRLRHFLVHDDRKPLERFVQAQLRYSEQELPRLLEHGLFNRGFKGRLRRSFAFTPILVWLVAWLRAGGPFNGAAARRYALERLLYEATLRWRVEDSLLNKGGEERCPDKQL